MDIVLPASTKEKRYCLLTKTVDEECCNPLKVWHDLGEWAHPTAEQTELLKAAAKPLVATDVIENKGSKINIQLSVKKHGVVYFELNPAPVSSDRGYNYNFDYSRH